MRYSYTLTLFLLFSFFNLDAQNVGIGTSTPDSSAQLDVSATNKGFLPPRVALTAINNAIPVTSPATGLLVFNTATSGSTPNNVKPGYYYWDGAQWVPVVNRANSYGDMQYWDGTKWVMIPLGLNGQVLTICGGVPQWSNGNCQNVLTIQPASNAYELNYNSYTPDLLAGSGNTQITMQAWTAFGNPLTSQQILKFDYSAIPLTAVIDSVKLFLYAVDNPLGGNTVDPHYGTSNACIIKRITSSWSLPCPYSWNNAPTVTSTNQASIPQSITAFDNNIINVTGLVKDMITNGNNGFLIKLQTEVTYNIRQYTSSFNANTAEHPKLVVYYH
ncbi:MAG: DNRLRE domain-containing protein [Chitinophagaceae bacterium]|nr:DNRLRE domain-containing protein [Chitinophagaceae bacterium]